MYMSSSLPLPRWMEVRRLAKVYADLIRKGLKTIDDVPAPLRADVEAILTENADEQDS